MPPAGQADGVAQPGKPDLTGQADRVLLGRPQGINGHRFLHAEPFPAGGAVTGPVQPWVFGEDLEPGTDDEDHQKQVEEVLPAHPGRETRGGRAGLLHGPGMGGDEALHRRDVAQALSRRHRHDQEHETDGQEPEKVEPPAAPDANPGGDSAALRHGSGPRGGGDDVLAGDQLVEGAADDVGGDRRRGPSGAIGRGCLSWFHAARRRQAGRVGAGRTGGSRRGGSSRPPWGYRSGPWRGIRRWCRAHRRPGR